MNRRRALTAASVLWAVLTVVVWNVVFDRVIVLEGRRYVHDATVSFETSGRYLLIDEVMRPAVVRATRMATAWAAGVLVVGGVLIWWAVRREKGRPGDRGSA